MTNEDRFKLLLDEVRIRKPLPEEHRRPQAVWDKGKGLLYLLLTDQGQEPSTMLPDLLAAMSTYTDTPGDLLITVRVDAIDMLRRTLTVSAPAGPNKRTLLEVPETRMLWVVAQAL